MATFYMGKDVTKMTKKELIEALRTMDKLRTEDYERHKHEIELLGIIKPRPSFWKAFMPRGKS